MSVERTCRSNGRGTSMAAFSRAPCEQLLLECITNHHGHLWRRSGNGTCQSNARADLTAAVLQWQRFLARLVSSFCSSASRTITGTFGGGPEMAHVSRTHVPI